MPISRFFACAKTVKLLVGGSRLCLLAQPLVVALAVTLRILHDRQAVLDAQRIVEWPHGPGASPKVSEFPGAVKGRRIPDDAAVFAFPLYVDEIPSHLVNCLCQLENYFTKHSSDLSVYAIVNCGFFEGNQNRYALEIMKNWCAKSGLKWGQGVGIGGGGMLAGLQNVPAGKGPRKNFSATINQLSEHITVGTSTEDIYVSPNIPRIAYKMGAEMERRQQIKANGLSEKDLFRRL